MSRLYLVLFLGAVLFAAIWGVAVYVNNLDEELPASHETNKRGRAEILIDSRWPFVDFRTLFSDPAGM
jgi:hypothetical protein